MKLRLFQYFSLCFACSRLKNVMFDISPCEEVGDFEIKAKFLGVEMEKVQLHFQVSSHVHRSSRHSLSFVSCCLLYKFYYCVSMLRTQNCFLCVFSGSVAAAVWGSSCHENVRQGQSECQSTDLPFEQKILWKMKFLLKSLIAKSN